MPPRNEHFSKKERFIARALSATPGLKKIVKKAYQYANYIVHKKPFTFNSDYSLQSFDAGPGRESFFGYYDKSPISPNGTYIIYQSCTYPSHLPPDSFKSVMVVCQNLQTGEVVARIPSAAYNWQQGTKLQWIGPDRFVFNAYDSDNDRYVANVYDLPDGEVVQKNLRPIYDCYGDHFALSLNYDRLARLAPDYGYFCRQGSSFDFNEIDADGVWHVDLNTGESDLILSLQTLVRLRPLPTMHEAKHSVNHIMIAPNGRQFMVIHRWYLSDRRYDRLVLCDVDGSNPLVVADDGMVSHCFWLSDKKILSFLRGPNGKDCYWIIDINGFDFYEFDCPDLAAFGDGHPHVHGDWFVTDTYPDKARMQHLFLCNWTTGKAKALGEFFHGFEYEGETRCDLHPRFSPDGKSIYFDSVFSGKRQLYRLELES